MKRLLIFIPLLLITTAGYSQEAALTAVQSTEFKHFGQCMLNLSSEEEYAALEASLRSNPNIEMVRLDRVSQRSFIISKTLSSLTVEEFRSWFGEFGDRVSCVQVGIHKIDRIETYPFTNCND